MGQVPGRASLLLIGDGRLAGHLHNYLQSRYLHREGISINRWSRRQDPSRADLPDLIAKADHVLLAINDDAIEGFLDRYRRPGGPIWVHFSGSLVVDGAWSAHPLSTFAGPAYKSEVYERIPFIVEQEGPPLGELIPGLDNPSAAIPRARKPLYHALCVAAGNFTQLLWHEIFQGFDDDLGLSGDLALPYLSQTCANLEQSVQHASGQSLLTGPIARGDQRTIQRNLDALRDAGRDHLARVYGSFVDLAGASSAELEEVAA